MKKLAIAAFIAALMVTPFAQTSVETLVVTALNTRGWTTADTRPGGAVSFTVDATAPGGTGALRLTTDVTTAAKAQYMHETSTPLADVIDLTYSTKQNAANFYGGDASYQLAVNLCGTTSSFTTFVFEPYENGTVVPGTWQTWDVAAGQMWSSKNVACESSSVTAGSGGAPYYTLAWLKAAFPNAQVVGFGVNVGSYNPSYDVETDLVRFNETIYDFEVFSTPATADDCKKGGWSTLNPPTGPYKNQGQCVSGVVTQ